MTCPEPHSEYAQHLVLGARDPEARSGACPTTDTVITSVGKVPSVCPRIPGVLLGSSWAF